MISKNLNEVKSWLENGQSTQFISQNFCSTRSEFNGRLVTYENKVKSFLTEACVYLTTSSIGEVGNNCFDHNLGFWNGPPGCLFVRESHFCIIADRGQGVKSSLSKVYQLVHPEESFLEVAYQKVITGRAPEKRGNGLKFTKKNILKCHLGLYTVSSGEEFRIGKILHSEIFQNFLSPKLIFPGTLTIISWY